MDILEKNYQKLIGIIESYHPSENTTVIRKAYMFARNAHEGQKRMSGEPFFIHPLETAIILAQLKADKETIIAALLHDVVEDTHHALSEIEEQFGSEIMFLVQGVTKLGALYGKEMDHVEDIKNIFVSTSKDIRVILIKLADRLHNMRTLEFQSNKKQKVIAQETMDIYVPVANRMGIFKVQVELEDLCLKYLYPESYYCINKKVKEVKEKDKEENEKLMKYIKSEIESINIACELYINYKNCFSIYRKMLNRDQKIDGIYDLYSVCVVVEDVMKCYECLGKLHQKFVPIPGRIKDFIAVPKENLYQSLHTTLIPVKGNPFEVQIRTKDMDATAWYGIMNYWRYKENERNEKNVYLENEKSVWLKKVLEWQLDHDNEEFIRLLKKDFNVFNKRIYCFTTRGKAVELPVGSTVVDFAYSLENELGDKLYKVKVNGKERLPIQKLNNGDVVDIIVDEQQDIPPFVWLKNVKTSKAENDILKFYKANDKSELQKGEEKFLEFCKENSGCNDVDGMKAAICWYYDVSDWNCVLMALNKDQIILDDFFPQVYNDFMEKNVGQQTMCIVVDNCIGVLASVAQWFSNNGINISKLCTENVDENVVISVSFISQGGSYNEICSQIKEITGVKEIVFKR